MKTFIFIQLLLFALFLSGCNKWDNDPNEKGCITRIENEDHETIAEYSYGKSGVLEESWDHNQFYMEDKNAEYSYSYNSKGELIGKKGFEPGNMIMSSMTGAMDKNVEYAYEYNTEGQVKRITVDYDYGEFSDLNFRMAFNYEYPDKKTVLEQIFHVNPLANSLSSVNEYQFDAKGNISKKITYYQTNLSEKQVNVEETYTYDNHSAPTTVEPTPASKNNIEKKTVTVYNYDENGTQSLAYVSVYTYTYTYNTDGYPKEVTEKMPNEILNINYYFYQL